MWHTRNLTQDQLDDLLGEIDNAAQDGLKEPKNVSRIISIVNEIKFRREQIISFDILLNIAAIAWVREDEEPTNFSQPIHEEKLATLEKECQDHYFFFQQTELKKLYSFQNYSEQEWQTFFKQSFQQKPYHDKAMTYLRSMRSLPTEKTSTKQ